MPVEIVVYDVSGRQITIINSDEHNPGYYSAVWNGTDEKQRRVSSGIYFVRYKTDDYSDTRKLILLK
jgi:hypothetical protein